MPEKREPEEKHAWEGIARQLAQEQDSAKVLDLAVRLNEALEAEEKEKAESKVGHATGRAVA